MNLKRYSDFENSNNINKSQDNYTPVEVSIDKSSETPIKEEVLLTPKSDNNLSIEILEEKNY